MMALYMPMQPSSKMPMMALLRRSSPARRAPSSSACGGSLQAESGRTWLGIVPDGLAREPAAQAGEEEIVGEIHAPERTVGDAGLGHARH